MFERMKIVVEASSATVLAAVRKMGGELKGKKVGVVLSGGNVEFGEMFDGLRKRFPDE